MFVMGYSNSILSKQQFARNIIEWLFVMMLDLLRQNISTRTPTKFVGAFWTAHFSEPFGH